MARCGIRTKPEPNCPECGARMVLRRPKMGQRWDPFWGCSTYPECEGKREIDEHGEPEEGDGSGDYEDYEEINGA